MTHPTRSLAAVALLGAASAALAQAPARSSADLDALNARINEQVQRLAELQRTLEREQDALQALRRAVGEQVLAERRGGQAAPAPVGNAAVTAVAGGTPIVAAPPRGDTAPARTPAPIFEEPSVLTPAGGVVIEPSIQYSNSSNNRVTLLGYTIVPALLVGLIDVREVKRNTTTAAIAARFGVSRRFELEARVPYLYRSDTTKAREIATGSSVDTVVGASGQAIGDVEIAGRYQLTTGNGALPLMIGSLRYKSRTGRDPFEVVTDCETRCVGNTTGTGQPLTLPTGSGFHSLQAGLTWLKPSDPAVLFGTFSYLHNFARDDVFRTVRDGERESLGRIAPGAVLGFNVGIGLALNERSSFSVGYDHNSVAPTKQNGITVPGSIRAQLGTLMFGYSYRLDERTSLNFSLGAGVTPDAADVTLGLRVPFSL